jgi:hypothetical protein
VVMGDHDNHRVLFLVLLQLLPDARYTRPQHLGILMDLLCAQQLQ